MREKKLSLKDCIKGKQKKKFIVIKIISRLLLLSCKLCRAPFLHLVR